MNPALLMAIKGGYDLLMEEDESPAEMLSKIEQLPETEETEITALIAPKHIREDHFRPQRYSEQTTNYLPEDHRRLFRMTQVTFNILLQYLRTKFPTIDTPYSGGLEPISAKKKLQIALLYFASQMTLRRIGDTLGVADSTVLVAKDEITEMLVQSQADFIRWPTEQEAHLISEEFQALANFPGCIGAIDGSYIAAKFRKTIGNDYINRKMFKSVVLQGVCTSKRFFTHIFVGVPGRAHDARVFRLSNIKKTILQRGKNALFYNENFHLIGDPAYALTTYMMVKYKHKNLTLQQKKFNKRLSQTRVKIEHTFGHLKGRFERTKYINTYKLEKVAKTVTACCVLHNFCLLNHDYMDELLHLEPPNAQLPLVVPPNDAQEHQLGLAKRQRITALL